MDYMDLLYEFFILFILVFICYVVLSLVSWIITSISITNILRNLNYNKQNIIEYWIPYWQFVGIAKLLEESNLKVYKCSTYLKIISIVLLLSLIAFFPVLIVLVCYFCFVAFIGYSIYMFSIMLYDKPNIFYVVLGCLGFSFIVYYIYDKRILENKDKIIKNYFCVVNDEVISLNKG